MREVAEAPRYKGGADEVAVVGGAGRAQPAPPLRRAAAERARGEQSQSVLKHTSSRLPEGSRKNTA